MHEFLHLLAATTNTPAPAPPDNSVKISIITAISVVFAAAVTGLATTITRHREPEVSSQTYIGELLRRAEVSERRADTLEHRADSLARRVDDLEGMCWHNGIDPDTGEPVARQPPNTGEGRSTHGSS